MDNIQFFEFYFSLCFERLCINIHLINVLMFEVQVAQFDNWQSKMKIVKSFIGYITCV